MKVQKRKPQAGTSDARRIYQTPSSNFLLMAPTVDIQSISSTLTDSVRFSPVAVLEAKLTTSSREDDVGEMWINIGPIYYTGN